ncbi:MAG TPA: type II secretion system F family protein [Baekduia sp.]|uniref:type II secretion system F family protein n=1 Tax=Baekduia sp. TaxID=2600305 RepID=UPI002D781742|nr:type II secretion system F family protein [Baekduia sp.]HET6505537.1 type II secretion system F family protein [Baekduia sp.]
MTSTAPALAALAAGAAVFGAWDLLTIVEAGGPARTVARVLAPLRLAGRAGRVPTPPERRRLAILGACSMLAAGWLLAGPFAGCALALTAPACVGPLLAARRRRWRRALVAAVPQVARAMADALAGGRSIRSALADLGRPGAVTGAAGTELRGAAHRLALGERTEAVLLSLRDRAQDPSWDTLVAAILLQREAGGDLAALLRTVADSTENARRVEADARSLMSQARASARLVAGLPVVSLVLSELVAPGSLSGMAADARSRLLLGAGLLLAAFAMFIINRIARLGAP